MLSGADPVRIGVIGKGGSGKTSASGMLMRAARALGLDVWGLDADFNQHLAAMFAADNSAIPSLTSAKAALVDRVIGNRSDITSATFTKFTTPAANSGVICLSQEDEWLCSRYHSVEPNLHLLRVGDYQASSHATGCYHGYTAVADILLNHLEMADNQCLVIDFTAGIDPLASPIFLKVDVLVLAVEVTLKGVAVARQWADAMQGYPVKLHLVANKVLGEEDIFWLDHELARQLPGLALGGVLRYEPALLRLERGEALTWNDFSAINREELTRLIEEFSPSPMQRREQQHHLRGLEQRHALRVI